MKVVCLADTHGFQNFEVPVGDLLLFAGDATMNGLFPSEVSHFLRWFESLPHKHKVFIAGNHDFNWETGPKIKRVKCGNSWYLENAKINIEGIRIWGTPVQPEFCHWAFNYPESKRKEFFKLIPNDIDILLTHCPPKSILDEGVGCPILLEEVELKKPKFHVFGHIHNGYGRITKDGITFINCSVLNDDYQRVNAPQVFEI